MLPLLVTQLPLAVGASATWLVVFLYSFPEADNERLSDIPGGLALSLILAAGVYVLFTFVGLVATITSVHALLTGKVIGLATALDPAFTRMGGVLVLGSFMVLLTISAMTLIVTVIGALLMLYLLLRYALAFHVFVIEGASPGAALRGSWMLVRANTVRMLAVVAGAAPVALGALSAAAMLAVILSVPFVSADPGRDAEVAFSAIFIGSLGLSVVPIGAFLVTSTTLFYLTLRSRERA